MLPQQRKIKRSEFPSFQDKKVQFNGVVLRVQCYERLTSTSPSLFSVIVPKKKYKTVSVRNLFKRRVFSIIEMNITSFDKTRFGKFVISPLVAVDDVSFVAIKEDIKSFVSKLS